MGTDLSDQCRSSSRHNGEKRGQRSRRKRWHVGEDYNDVRTNITFHLQLIGRIYSRGWCAHTCRGHACQADVIDSITRGLNNATGSNAIPRYNVAPFNTICRTIARIIRGRRAAKDEFFDKLNDRIPPKYTHISAVLFDRSFAFSLCLAGK